MLVSRSHPPADLKDCTIHFDWTDGISINDNNICDELYRSKINHRNIESAAIKIYDSTKILAARIYRELTSLERLEGNI